MSRWSIALVLLSGALTACGDVEQRPVATLGADFGNAVGHNLSRQIVDPAPASAEAGAPAFDGRRASLVHERYVTGTVAVPESVETTDFGKDN